MITNLDYYLNITTTNQPNGGLPMNNFEILTQLEAKDHELGCTIDVTLINEDNQELIYSIDTWDLLKYGIKSHCLNIDDYGEISTLDAEDFNRSDLIRPLRTWLKAKTPEEYLDGGYQWDETVKIGTITLYGNKYQYYINIAH